MAKRGVRRWIGLLGFVFVAIAAFSYTLLVSNTPLLGLDLQGGVSVVLKPKGEPSSDAINQAIAVIRNRVDAIGVAEPEITRQGDTILVQIPGVGDRDRALELVGQTAQLRFRPVCAVGGPPGTEDPGATTDTSLPADPNAVTDSTVAGDPTASSTTPPVSEQSLGRFGAGEGEFALGAQDTGIITDSTIPGDTAPVDPNTLDPNTPDPSALATQQADAGGCNTGTTPAPLSPDVCRTGLPEGADVSDQPALLPQCDADTGEVTAQFFVGPTLLTGESLESASAGLDQRGEWIVNPTFKGGADGIDKFNEAAVQCNSKAPACPTGQLAVVLDGEVISAPSINEAQFARDQIQISGSFTERSARNLSTVLKYGVLPVEFEQQQVQIVSATLGEDALHAGLWSGVVGFILVAIYMIAFYRLLGLMAIGKLALEGMLLWSIISLLGETQGLALTLAGITGLIVSIGVSVDSNVVYYEHMKEDIRNGRTVRSATDKAFISSWSTIVKADVASLIGAVLLYVLTVGPVRGFAFYLGLATLLDLFASYFYMRPVVGAVMNSKRAQNKPGQFGMPSSARPDLLAPSNRTEPESAEVSS